MTHFTHLDSKGQAHMVDVSAKAVTARTARASASVTMQPQTLEMILAGGHAKGDVLATARIAGIQAAKRTPDLIPLCHPLMLSRVTVDLQPDPQLPGIRIEATCKLAGQTGVEMEALTAASVAALTLYDMCKAVDKTMLIGDIRVLQKQGGKSGDWLYEADTSAPASAASPVQGSQDAALQVRFFAELREQMQQDELQVAVASLQAADYPLTVAGLSDWLHQQFPALKSGRLMVAVNQQMAELSTALKSGDEVAFFPPVTGG